MGDVANLADLLRSQGYHTLSYSELEDKGTVRIFGRRDHDTYVMRFESGERVRQFGSVGRRSDQFLSAVDGNLKRSEWGLCSARYVQEKYFGIFSQYLEGRLYCIVHHAPPL